VHGSRIYPVASFAQGVHCIIAIEGDLLCACVGAMPIESWGCTCHYLWDVTRACMQGMHFKDQIFYCPFEKTNFVDSAVFDELEDDGGGVQLFVTAAAPGSGPRQSVKVLPEP
jgi:hypothetical protein